MATAMTDTSAGTPNEAASLCLACKTFEEEVIKFGAKCESERRPPSGSYETFGRDEHNPPHTFGQIENGALAGCPCCRILRWAVVSALAPDARRGNGERIDSSEILSILLNPRLEMGNDGKSTFHRLEAHIRVPKSNGSHRPNSSNPEASDTITVVAIMPRRRSEAVEGPSGKVVWLGATFEQLTLTVLHWQPRSDEVFSVARKWLKSCRECHTLCRQGPENRSPPSRLVEIRRDGARLIETHGGRYEYCALSYCWGKTDFKGATQERMAEYLVALPVASIPSTITDAFEVAAALGFRHIWVDALCIIQDDEADWLVEARNMSSVYEGAALTLAASSALSCQGSLFVTREHARYPLIPFEFAGVTLCPVKFADDFVYNRPWRRRAWTMQEESLARRVLYWDQLMLSWICREAQWYEWGREKRSEQSMMLKWSSKPPSIISFSNRLLLGCSGDDLVYAHWRRACRDYWARSVTLSRDWPVAMLGMASIAQQMLPNDRLVWGMWERKLLEDMLWTWTKPVWDNTELSAIPRNAYAPTWSWFSRLGQGELLYPSESNLDDPMALCLSIDASDDGIFPREATVRLRAWVIKDWTKFAEHFWAAYQTATFVPLMDLGSRSWRPEYAHWIKGLLLRSKTRTIEQSSGSMSEDVWYREGTQDLFLTDDEFAELQKASQEEMLLV